MISTILVCTLNPNNNLFYIAIEPTKLKKDGRYCAPWLAMSASCREFPPPKTTDMPTCQCHVADTTQTMSATWHRVGSSDAVSVSCRHDNLPTCRHRVVDHGRRPPHPLPPLMPLQRPIHRFGPARYIICDVVCTLFAQNRAGSLIFHWFGHKGN